MPNLHSVHYLQTLTFASIRGIFTPFNLIVPNKSTISTRSSFENFFIRTGYINTASFARLVICIVQSIAITYTIGSGIQTVGYIIFL